MSPGVPCAKFRLPRPFSFRVRADVRDIRQTDGQTDRQTDGRTTDADHRIMPPRRGHNKVCGLCWLRDFDVSLVCLQFNNDTVEIFGNSRLIAQGLGQLY